MVATFSFFLFYRPVEELGRAHGIIFTWLLFMGQIPDGRVLFYSKRDLPKGRL